MGPKWECLSLFGAVVQGERSQEGSCCAMAKRARAAASTWRASAKPEGAAGHVRSPCNALLPQQVPSSAALLSPPQVTLAPSILLTLVWVMMSQWLL